MLATLNYFRDIICTFARAAWVLDTGGTDKNSEYVTSIVIPAQEGGE